MKIELFIILILVIYILIIFIKSEISKFKVKRNLKKGLLGEIKAANFLQKKGYKIISYQKEVRYNYNANGEEIEVRVRPDYIVKKNGKKYIAEVKTGEFVSDFKKNSQTRRQLLEYDFAMDNYGTLLIDMEKDKIIKIEFKKKKNRFNIYLLRLLLIFSVLINLILYYYINV
ncbi:MAG: hypothetical protein GX287_04070 [Fusobacteria bacterium]|nr:hypothetical protein [Fusobacteriota bacterium]